MEGEVGAVVRRVVRGAIHLLEVSEVPRRHGVHAGQASRDARDALAALAHVRGAVAHHGAVQHGVVERVLVHDGVVHHGVAGRQVLDRLEQTGRGDRLDLIVVAGGVGVRIDDPVRQRGRGIEYAVERRAEGEQAAIGGEVADLLAADVAQLGVDVHHSFRSGILQLDPGRRILGVLGAELAVVPTVHIRVALNRVDVGGRVGHYVPYLGGVDAVVVQQDGDLIGDAGVLEDAHDEQRHRVIFAS